MADTLSASSIPEEKTTGPVKETLVNTNGLLQKALLQVSKEERSRVILRCDDLPNALGCNEDLETIFTCLLQLLFRKGEHVQKLFLHVHCTTGRHEESFSDTLNRFTIQFNTNITPSADWLNTEERLLQEVATCLHKNGGSLDTSTQPNTGCIFSVSLLGKTL